MTLIDRNSHFFLSVADCVIRARWQLWKKEKEGCDSKPSSWLTFWPDRPKLARKKVFPLLLFLEKSALCSRISEDKYELCVQLLMESVRLTIGRDSIFFPSLDPSPPTTEQIRETKWNPCLAHRLLR